MTEKKISSKYAEVLAIFENAFNAPFEHCCAADKLQDIASSLSKFAENMAQDRSIVISIDAPYGTGKSTFIDNWGKDINQKAFQSPSAAKAFVIKFDAWRADYAEDPMVAIIGEITTQLDKIPYKENVKKQFKNEIKEIAKIGNQIFFSASKFLGKDVKGLVDGVKGACLNDVEKLLYNNPYYLRKTLLNTFKNRLKEIIELCKFSVLYFFVDELDRCKPSFAIEILEIIKHVFDIPKVCFVLSVHQDALLSSVAKIYGYDHNMAMRYLERFIDVPVALPSLKASDFLKYEAKSLLKHHNIINDNYANELILLCCERLVTPRIIKKYIMDLTLLLNKIDFSDKNCNIPKQYIYAIVFLLHLKRLSAEEKTFYYNFFVNCSKFPYGQFNPVPKGYLPSSKDFLTYKLKHSLEFLYWSKDPESLAKYCDQFRPKAPSFQYSQELDEAKKYIHSFIFDIYGGYGNYTYKVSDTASVAELKNYKNHLNLVHESIEFLSYFNQNEAQLEEVLLNC